jgi:hypothetical protein
MLQPGFDPAPVAVRIYRIQYASKCKAPRCLGRATTVAEKVDGAGPLPAYRPLRAAPEDRAGALYGNRSIRATRLESRALLPKRNSSSGSGSV